MKFSTQVTTLFCIVQKSPYYVSFSSCALFQEEIPHYCACTYHKDGPMRVCIQNLHVCLIQREGRRKGGRGGKREGGESERASIVAETNWY